MVQRLRSLVQVMIYVTLFMINLSLLRSSEENHLLVLINRVRHFFLMQICSIAELIRYVHLNSMLKKILAFLILLRLH